MFDPHYAKQLPVDDGGNTELPTETPDLSCEAGLWETCCPNEFWIPITDEDFTESECKSLIAIGTIYEPIYKSENEFYIYQLWTIRGTMLVSVVMPFIAIVSGK